MARPIPEVETVFQPEKLKTVPGLRDKLESDAMEMQRSADDYARLRGRWLATRLRRGEDVFLQGRVLSRFIRTIPAAAKWYRVDAGGAVWTVESAAPMQTRGYLLLEPSEGV